MHRLATRRTEKKVRPTHRWMDGVELDLRNADVIRRRTGALDRIKWASVIRETGAKFKGL
jgi:hypothetical protein